MSSGPEEFVRFARAVAEDAGLTARLRQVVGRDAFVAAAVAEGATLSFAFAAEDMDAVMQSNRTGWLMHPTPLLAYPAT